MSTVVVQGPALGLRQDIVRLAHSKIHDPAATLKLVERENEVVPTAARKLGLAK